MRWACTHELEGDKPCASGMRYTHTHTEEVAPQSHVSKNQVILYGSSPCTEEMLPESPCHLPCSLYSTERDGSKTPPYRAFSFQNPTCNSNKQFSSLTGWHLSWTWCYKPLTDLHVLHGPCSKGISKRENEQPRKLKIYFFF